MLEFFETLSAYYRDPTKVDLNQKVLQKASVQDVVNLIQNVGNYHFKERRQEYADMYTSLVEEEERVSIGVLNKMGEQGGIFVAPDITKKEAGEFMSTLLKLKKQHKGIIDTIFLQNAQKAMQDINELHVQPLQRKALVRALPTELYPFIIAQGERGIGGRSEIYRSSYELVMENLAVQSGGHDKIITNLEAMGLKKEDPVMSDFLITVSSVGQFDQILPDDPTKQEEYGGWLLDQFKGERREKMGQVGFSVKSMLRNPRTKNSFQDIFFTEYDNVLTELENYPYDYDQDLENKKRVLQYWMLENEANLPQNRLKDIEFDESVLKARERLNIPITQWLENGDVEEGRKVIKGKVYFTSLKDPSEKEHFDRLRLTAQSRGYKVTPAPNGYILTKDTEIPDPETGEKKPVRVKYEVTTDLKDVGKALTDAKTQIVVARGHSGDTDEVWESLSTSKSRSKTRKLGIIGSCSGARKANEKGSSPDVDFIGTTGTGYGDVNNNIMLLTMDALKDGVTTYDDLSVYIKQRYKGERQKELKEQYQFPKAFIAAGLVQET